VQVEGSDLICTMQDQIRFIHEEGKFDMYSGRRSDIATTEGWVTLIVQVFPHNSMHKLHVYIYDPSRNTSQE